jgi:multiple sugar transport system permease protein
MAAATTPDGRTRPFGAPTRTPLDAREHRRLARGHALRRTRRAYAFLAPNLVFFTLFLLIPCGWVFYASLRTGGVLGPSQYVGLQNWKHAFSDPLVVKTIRNTFLYSVIAIPIVFALGLGLALLLQNISRGSTILRALLYFPTLMPVVLAALAWLFVVHPDFGVLNYAVRGFGGSTVNWLGSTGLALPTIAMLEIWRGLGFWTLLFLAALLGMPRELFHAAHLDGAGVWQRFRYLTVPLLRSTFLFALVMATIWNLQLFDSIFILTDGGPVNSTATIVWYVYRSLFAFGNVGFGATLSCLMLVVILVLTVIELRLLRPRRTR